MNAPNDDGSGGQGASATSRRNDHRLVLGCVALFAVGTTCSWLVPQIVHGVTETLRVSVAQAGLVATIELLLGGVLSIALAARPPQTSFRRLALIAFAIWLPVNILSYFAPSLWTLVGLRMLSGLANGVTIYVSTALAASALWPGRAYALMNIAANAYPSATIAVIAEVAPATPALAYLPYAALAGLLWLPLIAALPNRARLPAARAADVELAGPTFEPRRNVFFLLLTVALVLITFQGFVIWTFSVDIGQRLGLAFVDVSKILSVAGIVGFLGSLAAGYMPARFGRILPIASATFIYLVSNFTTVTTDSAFVFRICQIVNQADFFFVYPLLLGWAAHLDPRGRAGSTMAGAYTVTLALSPALGGSLIAAGSLSSLATLTLTLSGAALVCLLTAQLLAQLQPVPVR